MSTAALIRRIAEYRKNKAPAPGTEATQSRTLGWSCSRRTAAA